MKLKADQQADVLYLTLSEAPASRSEEVSSGFIVDYVRIRSESGLTRRAATAMPRVIPDPLILTWPFKEPHRQGRILQLDAGDCRQWSPPADRAQRRADG